MTVSVNQIRSLLPPYKGDYSILSKYQSVDDIIKGIKQYHNLSAKDYEKIAPLFKANSSIKTLENIYYFLRENVLYIPESLDEQKVKTPSAIIAERKNGTDCKNFSLFSCGIIDALNRMGLSDIPYCYRFVSYDILNSDATHVFCVAYPGSNEEIFIDAVLPQFNLKTNYFYKTDKKYKAMLYGVSGFKEQINETHSADYIPNDYLSLNPQNTKYSSLGDVQGDLATTAVKAGADALIPGAGEILGQTGILDIFSASGVSPSFFSSFGFLSFLDNSVDHWKSRAAKFKSWTPSQILAYYVSLINKPNPNFEDIQQFAQLFLNLHNNDQGKLQFLIAPQLDYKAAQVYNAIVEKVLFPNNANLFDRGNGEKYYKTELTIPLSQTKGYNPLTNIFQTSSTNTTTAGMSTLLILGLIGAGLYFFTRKK